MKTKAVKINKKVVGNIKGKTFSRELDSSKDFLRTPPAITFDELALSKVEDTLTGISYYSTINAIRSRGFSFNRGFGSQVGLALSEWSKNEESQVKIFDITK